MTPMPYSSNEGKDWLVERILNHLPVSVLDVGPGAGNYEALLRPLLPNCLFAGIEIWQPYVRRFNLARRYEWLWVRDVMDFDPLPIVDVVILGDVLEHLDQPDAVKLWGRARQAARKAVFLSLPIVDYPQGEVYGNPYETHRYQWTDDEVRRELPGITDAFALPWPGQTIGAYEATPERKERRNGRA